MYPSHARPYKQAQRRDVAKEAFEKAKIVLQDVVSNQVQARRIVFGTTTIEDVLIEVGRVKSEYEMKAKKRSKFAKCLHDLSSLSLHYSQVLDALAQHHPEYVSLAWGAIKFALMGVINYAELTENLSEAMSDIGQVLSEVNLSCQLYPSEQIRDVSAVLYEHILNFFLRAVRWYSMNTAQRLARSFTWPFRLEYQDILSRIRQYAGHVQWIASGESKIELRSISLELKQLGTDFHGLRKEIRELQGLHPKVDQVIHATDVLRSMEEKIGSQVDSMDACVHGILHYQVVKELCPVIKPEDSLSRREYAVRRNERSMGPSYLLSSVLAALTQWQSSPHTSILILQPGARANAAAKDLIVNVISQIKSQQYKVLWALSQPPSHNAAPSPANVLKSLLYQVLRMGHDTLRNTTDGLNIRKFGDNHSPTEWLHILSQVLPAFGKCFIIVESEDIYRLSSGDEKLFKGFLSLFSKLADRMQEQGSPVKILVVDYGREFPQEDCPSQAHQIVATVRRRNPIPPHRRRTAGQIVLM